MSKTFDNREVTDGAEKSKQIVTCTERLSPHQDSCWSWLVCVAAVLSNVVICGFTFSFGILFPTLLDEFQQGKAKTAWVGSIAMMGIGIYGPVVGRLYHRFGARIVSFFGSIICAVSLVITSRISNLYVMYFTYGLLFGFGSCGVFLITYIAMPRYFVRWRSLSLGLIAMGPGGGLFIMSPIVQALFDRFGWRGTFLAMAGIVSLTCILAFVYRPIKLDSNREELNVSQARDNKFWDTSILKHKVFVFVTIAGIVIYMVHYTPSVHMVRYLQEAGFAEVDASRLYMYNGLASLLIRPLIGRLNDVSWVNMLYIYSLATALEGVAAFLLPLATTNFHFAVYSVLFGLTDGTLGAGLSIAVITNLPENLRPLGISVYQSLSSMSSACAPALGGLVADLTGSYTPMFNMVGGISMIGAAILLCVSCIKKTDNLGPVQTSNRSCAEPNLGRPKDSARHAQSVRSTSERLRCDFDSNVELFRI